jgi:hypothetical protein
MTETHGIARGQLAALDWISGGDTGASSKAIWCVMMGRPDGGSAHPLDPGDVGRCFRLLERVPEWKARMHLMRGMGPYWDALVDRWDEIRACLEEECGIDFEKSRVARKTYDLMRSILKPIEEKDPCYVRFGVGGIRILRGTRRA